MSARIVAVRDFGTFSTIPKSTSYSEIEEEAKQKWQKEWENFTKAAITKQFFPNYKTGLN
jgi:hypothetical protein